MARPGTVDKEEVSAMLPLRLVGSTSRLRMVVRQEDPVPRDTANRPSKQELRIIAGMLRNCQPRPKAPSPLLFVASIWFCG